MKVMTQEMRDRIAKRALAGDKAKQIGERYGYRPDHIIRTLLRAEKLGEVPPGTADKAREVKPAALKAEVSTGPFNVFAPQRRVAADMGCCSYCNSPTDIALDARRGAVVTRIKLCAVHAPELRDAISAAINQASTKRMSFTGEKF